MGKDCVTYICDYYPGWADILEARIVMNNVLSIKYKVLGIKGKLSVVSSR